MMAAATAARAGARVLLLEKNVAPGRKLALTGGGRCNITNNKPDVRTMLSSYKTEGKFLFSTFMQHGVKETIEWFAERGVAVKEENEGRLFPVTESAETMRATLRKELATTGVTIRTKEAVSAVSHDVRLGQFTVTTATSAYQARTCVLATGGYARPETGSTGDGFLWLQELGHKVVPNNDALVPVALQTTWTKKLSGLTLPQVQVSVWSQGKKKHAANGRLLFTHAGVTGPLILNMSKLIGDLLADGPVELTVDVVPQYDAGAYKIHLATLLQSNKKLQNALTEDIPAQLVKAILQELSIAGDTPCHSVSTADRTRLRSYLKAVPLSVAHLLGSDKAIVSSGGVDLVEIDFKTMSSKIVPGLYIVGDLLNINRPSGGYSLQLCWSTGYVAGKCAAENIAKS